MSESTSPFIVVGAGQAGLQVCDSLRREGYEGQIVLLGDEKLLPYQRPPLSKQYLEGELDQERLPFRPASFYEKKAIEFKSNVSVTSIDLKARTLLANGEILDYERLALTTGTRVRKLPIPGGELPGIHYLRTVTDADAIKKDLSRCKSLIAIGGGFIGLEISAVAKKMGLSVTVVEAQSRLMERAVSPVISDYFLQVHQTAGVTIELAALVEQIEDTPNGYRINLGDGRQLDADMVIAGIGALPNQELGQAAGIECDNGILVDQYAQTSDLHVVAAGDCTMHSNIKLNTRHRLESVQNAVDQAKVAAATMTGKRKPYDQIPWFWSDQYDVKLQMVGIGHGHDEAIIRGAVTEHAFSVFYFREGRLLGIDSVNRPLDHMIGRKLLNQGATLSPAQAGDESVDLKSLI